MEENGNVETEAIPPIHLNLKIPTKAETGRFGLGKDLPKAQGSQAEAQRFLLDAGLGLFKTDGNEAFASLRGEGFSQEDHLSPKAEEWGRMGAAALPLSSGEEKSPQ